MKTLKDAKVGETVKATKLTGEGSCKTSYHGHGNYQGRRDLCP